MLLRALVFQVIVSLFAPMGRAVPVDLVNRYADAIANVVETEKLPFRGEQAKERTALLLTRLAFRESAVDWESVEMCTFRTDHGWQDDGRSIGVPQLGPAAWYGHTRDEICGNVELQFRLGLRYLTEQVTACGGDIEKGLTKYNRNVCQVSLYGADIANGYRRLANRFGLHP